VDQELAGAAEVDPLFVVDELDEDGVAAGVELGVEPDEDEEPDEPASAEPPLDPLPEAVSAPAPELPEDSLPRESVR
jgi:hypothetical protein